MNIELQSYKMQVGPRVPWVASRSS